VYPQKGIYLLIDLVEPGQFGSVVFKSSHQGLNLRYSFGRQVAVGNLTFFLKSQVLERAMGSSFRALAVSFPAVGITVRQPDSHLPTGVKQVGLQKLPFLS